MTAGYGTSEYGTGPWGVGAVYAPENGGGRTFATGDRSVRVVLSFEPQAQGSTLPGDALNPKTWAISSLNDGRVLTPISVVKVNATTFDILTLQMLDNAKVSMQLRTIALRDVMGAPVATLTWTFPGSQLVSNTTPQRQTTAAGLALRDIANPPTPNSPVGGTLEITSSGDYKSVTGEALVRKLIIRRLISSKGDFFHLPNYGAGLRVKDTMANVDLRKLSRELESQIMFEPEVEAASVGLSYTAAASALVVQLKVKLRQTGQEVSVSMMVPSGTLAF